MEPNRNPEFLVNYKIGLKSNGNLVRIWKPWFDFHLYISTIYIFNIRLQRRCSIHVAHND